MILVRYFVKHWRCFFYVPLLSLLSSSLPRCMRSLPKTEQARPCFEQWPKIKFHCSNIYRVVCYVSACSFTKVVIVPEWHFLSFLFPLKASVVHIAEWVYELKLNFIPITIEALLFKWGSLQAVYKPMSRRKRDEKEKNKLITYFYKPTWQMPVFDFLACSKFLFIYTYGGVTKFTHWQLIKAVSGQMGAWT